MAYLTKAGVIGVAIAPCVTDQRRSLEELLYDMGHAALRDAGLTIEDIDGIVVASNDQYDGRAISVMAASGSVGGVDRDILSTPSAGEHALVMGALRVLSGQYRTQLVLAWSPTEASPLPEAQRLAADPYFHRRLPLDEPAADALQASALLAADPGLAEAAREIAARNRRNGTTAYPDLASAARPWSGARWPLEPGMVAAPVTGAVALVLASDAYVAERGIRDPAWIAGMGWATEPSFLGDRDLSDAPALRAAAEQAFGEAGGKTADLAEVADATPYQQLLASRVLGLGANLPVNLSGGAQSFNPVYCTGLIRIAEAANQVRGRAGRHQRAGTRTALAHAASGFAMQYQTVIMLRGEAA
ncbi:MAG TPA: hypothetical protein VFA03_03505 [Acetobacteraceae bacterium]|nr:hypothetical protein [Acetobacteraceae bacterium]